MLLSHFDTAVPEKDRHLLDRNSGQEEFDCERVAKHVGAARLRSSIQVSDIGDAKQLAKAALVTLDRAGQIAMSALEQIFGADRR